MIKPTPSSFEIKMEPQERGIIISNPMNLNGNVATGISSDIDPNELRRALLFWDKVVWPSTSGIFFSGGVDIEFLQAEGKIIRPHFGMQGEAATALAMAFAETYRKLEVLHPGQWIVSNGEKSLKIHGQDIAEGRGVITQITNAIPVPDRAMPLEDIIRFKDGRFAEVQALRTVIDEFYQSWINSEDQDHQLKLALTKINVASADMVKVARESGHPFSMSSWKINFNITAPDVMKSAAFALGGAGAFDLSMASSLLAGALSAVSFGSGIGLRGATKNSPFNYVASMERELL